MGGQVVGGRSLRGGHHDAVADEAFHPCHAIDGDVQLGRLCGLAEQGHFVECHGIMRCATGIRHLHLQRVQPFAGGADDALQQSVGAIRVHQEPDRALVHAVDMFAGVEETELGGQHEAVSTHRDDDVSVVGLDGLIPRHQVRRALTPRRQWRPRRSLWWAAFLVVPPPRRCRETVSVTTAFAAGRPPRPWRRRRASGCFP